MQTESSMKALIEKFGKAYLDYKREIYALIPLRGFIHSMYIEHSIVIKGDLNNVFQLMADVESWHENFPHVYRNEAKILKKEGGKLLIERDGVIKWKSFLTINRDNKLIQAEHLKGLTKGLIAIWKFEKIPEGTKMIATHKFKDKISLTNLDG